MRNCCRRTGLHPEFIATHPSLTDLGHSLRPAWRSWVLGAFVLTSGLLHAALLLLPTVTPPSVRDGGEPDSLQVALTSVAAPNRPTTPPGSTVPAAPAAEPIHQHMVPSEAQQRGTQTQPRPYAEPQPQASAEAVRAEAPARSQSDQKPTAARTSRSVAASQPATTPSSASSSASSSAQANAARSAPVSPSSARPSRADGAAADATPSTQPGAAPAPAQEDVAERLRQQLGRSLQAHFHYPRIARHRGWEGLVEVGLRVEANGRLSDIRVLRTSGFSVLDRAAVASVGRIHHLRDAPRWLGGHGMDLVLPVQYRLIDG